MTLAELADRIGRQMSASLAAEEDWQRFGHFVDLARNGVGRFDLSNPAAVIGATGWVEWAAITIRSAGRTGLILMATLPRGNPRRGCATSSGTTLAMRQAVAQLIEQERARKMGLLQALLPPTQTDEARLLTDCGFVRLAELIYLMGDLPDEIPGALRKPDHAPAAGAANSTWPALPSDSCVTYHNDTADDFVRVIRASYVHTLDCPSLEGVRKMEDVLAGHKASGLFRPDLWFLFIRGGEPIGAVLLNQVLDPSYPTVELVYMGLVESARGLGLGGRMFRFALHSARRAGFDRIVTAVDAENLPALTLYRHAGLNETMRRIAYILALD